jgi:hypothetical protein
MYKRVIIDNILYILVENKGKCMFCKGEYVSYNHYIISECLCGGCIVSGGTTPRAKVSGHNFINNSVWKNVETGETVTHSQLFGGQAQ